MSKHQKAVLRLLSRPKDYAYKEAEALAMAFGYSVHSMGRTSGPRTRFKRNGYKDITLHKPHPRKELKRYQIDSFIKDLKGAGLI